MDSAQVRGDDAASTGVDSAANAQVDSKPGTATKRQAYAAHTSGSAVIDNILRGKNLALTTVGMATSRARMLPSFLMVGAARCGTTSMYLALRQHPAVLPTVSGRKHLNYFDDKYHRGPAWYQSHFPLKAQARRTARRTGVTPVAFEATPDYMFHPLAPERIARDLPGVKLIAMVRDPVERAGSAHAYQVIDGYEKESFERALELEDSRLAGAAERLVAEPNYYSFNYQHFGYRIRGHYADQLERLEKHFGRDRIHVVDSDEFFANPGPVYDQVIDFLGLPDLGRPSFGKHNSRPRTPMPDAVRAALEEHYRPHDERLTTWLGHEPSWRHR